MPNSFALPAPPDCLVPAKRRWNAEQRKYAKTELLVRMCHGEPVTHILQSDRERLPTYGALLQWKRNDEEFAEAYEDAQKDQAEIWLQMAIDESLTPPWMDPVDVEISKKVQRGELSPMVAQSILKSAIHANMQFRKTKIDTLKWYAGKMHPQRFGSESGKEDKDSKQSTASIELVQFER